jgi:hypothetical protein
MTAIIVVLIVIGVLVALNWRSIDYERGGHSLCEPLYKVPWEEDDRDE